MNVTQVSTFVSTSATTHLGLMAAHVSMATDKGPTCDPVKVGYAMRLLPQTNLAHLSCSQSLSESTRPRNKCCLATGTEELGPQESVDIYHYQAFKFHFLTSIRTSL